mmetsp:Transcript_32631/g.65466  ORF Transcript_32631/g.65466 Transcript_32631/m.65466 type:complete len:386 (-) Transcript_32631:464-1621(-)
MQDDHRGEREFDSTEACVHAVRRHFRSGQSKQPAVERHRIPVSRSRALDRDALLSLDFCILDVVLDRREANPTVKLRETNDCVGGEEEGEVLHHALEARGLLERRLTRVRVLGVHKLVHLPLGGLEDCLVAFQPKHEDVDVPWERRVARRWVLDVACGKLLGGAKQRIELVVLDVDGDDAAVGVRELTYAADRLARRTRDADGVDVHGLGRGHAEHAGEGAEDDAVGILKEDNPLDAGRRPLADHARLVHERVHVAVSVRLGLDHPVLDRHPRLAVDEGRDLVLLHDCDLALVQAEVSVLLEELHRQLVRVVARHDRQRNLPLVAVLGLQPQDVLRVQLQEAHLALGEVQRQRHLDPSVPQPLPQTTCDQHEACLVGSGNTGLLH